MPRNKINYKWLLFVVTCLFSPITLSGQRNQLPRIDRAKMSIVNILKNLDFDTQLNSGVIYFSDGQCSYILECAEETDALFFGKLSTPYNYDNLVTYERVSMFADNHNFKATKIVQNENEYSFRSEFYFSDTDFIYESIGLFINTIKKAESMLKFKCLSYAEKKVIDIDSLRVYHNTDSIPNTIKGEIVIKSNKAVGDTITVMVRIYCDNALIMDDVSTDKYSFSQRIIIMNDHQITELNPWVLSDRFSKSSYLRYEIWDENDHYISSTELKE